MLEKAIIPLNLHESLQQVTEMCKFLNNIGTTSIFLLHVGSNRGRAGARRRSQLKQFGEHIEKEGLETDIALRPGSLLTELFQASQEIEADFISMPFKKKNWISRAILGSHVKDVIRQSEVPVFVYKTPRRIQQTDEAFRMLYAVSLKGKDDSVLPYVRANRFQADEIIFLHVGSRAPDPVVEQKREEQIQLELETFRSQCGLAEEQVTNISLLGIPRNKIIWTARRMHADIILLGKADTESGMGPVLGSTAEEVSYNAPCSVLIIPKQEVPQ